MSFLIDLTVDEHSWHGFRSKSRINDEISKCTTRINDDTKAHTTSRPKGLLTRKRRHSKLPAPELRIDTSDMSAILEQLRTTTTTGNVVPLAKHVRAMAPKKCLHVRRIDITEYVPMEILEKVTYMADHIVFGYCVLRRVNRTMRKIVDRRMHKLDCSVLKFNAIGERLSDDDVRNIMEQLHAKELAKQVKSICMRGCTRLQPSTFTELLHCTNVTKLDLGRCRLNSSVVRQMLETFCLLEDLRLNATFTLDWHSIQSLTMLQHLRILNISGCSLSMPDRVFAVTMFSLRDLRCLKWHSEENFSSQSGPSSAMRAFSILDVRSDSAWFTNFFVSAAPLRLGGATKHLSLAINTGGFHRISIVSALRALKNCSNLETLHLEGFASDQRDADTSQLYYVPFTHLRILEIGCSNFVHPALIAFVIGCGRNSLHTLCLRSMNISDDWLTTFSQFVSPGSSIETLDISGNMLITIDGARLLAGFSSLRTIYCSGCEYLELDRLKRESNFFRHITFIDNQWRASHHGYSFDSNIAQILPINQ